MSKRKQHKGEHKYERCKLGSWKKTGHEIYKCMIPGCTHYMIDLRAVVGRYSQCWGILADLRECPNEVEMTRYLVFNEKRKHPLCEVCKQARKIKRELKKDPEFEIKMKRKEDAIERMIEGL